jgi:hypothetical protein
LIVCAFASNQKLGAVDPIKNFATRNKPLYHKHILPLLTALGPPGTPTKFAASSMKANADLTSPSAMGKSRRALTLKPRLAREPFYSIDKAASRHIPS